MNRSLRWPLAAVLVLALVVLAVVLIIGRDTAELPSEPAHPPGDAHTHIEGPTPENSGAATTAQMALSAMFSWQPAVDDSPGTALSRAMPWLTGELAEAAAAGPATGVRPLAEWDGWRRSGDIVTAIVDADQPKTTADETVLAATVRQIVLHRDGSQTPYQRMDVTATVVKTPQGWRLASYQVNTGN
ncbi:hypothetical protein ACFVVM_32850 [Nocardia sp. NPDC058176]|uniref:hypothetical protein n=1 Tax=Nocardia sp. NPDC058176 TaxID=3346368 RepID=UPI0036D791DE